VAFRRAVLKIGGGEREGLPNVVRLKLGIVAEMLSRSSIAWGKISTRKAMLLPELLFSFV
jgi:hypothetical protein